MDYKEQLKQLPQRPGVYMMIDCKETTDTELDALFIEECHLIRQLKPRYNKQMKNPSNYLFIKISSELFPKVAIVKEKTEDSAQYFGPLNSYTHCFPTLYYLDVQTMKFLKLPEPL